MVRNPFFFWGMVILALLSSETSSSQVIQDSLILIAGRQIEVKVDNDFFLLSDRYYSSGLFLTYRTALKKGFLGSNEQLAITMGQEVYTPAQTQSTNSADFDRPYVGFTGINTSWSMARESELFQVDLLLGIAGLNSGAGGLQRWFHDIVDISKSPLWIDELPNSIHINLRLRYVKEWQIALEPLGIHFAFIPNFALGTRDIYIEPEGIFYIGKRTKLSKSIAYNRLAASAREHFFSFHYSYRQVFYNALLEGNIINNNAIFSAPATNTVLRLGLDFNLRSLRNDYRFGIRYNTAESPLASSHRYIILTYGLRF